MISFSPQLDHKFVEEDGITKNSVNDLTHIFLKNTAKESCTQLPDTGKLFSKKSFFISSSNKTHKIKKDVITCLNKVNKNSWSQNALSYLVIGTQQGEIYIVDSQSFFTIEKYKTSSALMAIEPLGQWLRGGILVTACRNRKIGCFYRKKKFIMWERSISPVVVMSAINHTGVVVVTMDKTISFFSKQGKKLWKFIVQSYVLDLMSFQMPQTGAFLFAFSMANFGIYVYDQKQQLDFMRVSDTVSCFKRKCDELGLCASRNSNFTGSDACRPRKALLRGSLLPTSKCACTIDRLVGRKVGVRRRHASECGRVHAGRVRPVFLLGLYAERLWDFPTSACWTSCLRLGEPTDRRASQSCV
uniref:Bardet-Biedl syndrome 1 N-terminal domain-containing protein n=1 Tax=Trichogramma kaykai TaxID=54128 RepID=A0ABD2X839_9HYME